MTNQRMPTRMVWVDDRFVPDESSVVDVDPAEMTSRWVVSRCPYCDDHGYLPNGFRCPHEPPKVTAERAHRGAQLARTQLRPTNPPAEEEPA